jgi:hypothetical protein
VRMLYNEVHSQLNLRGKALHHMTIILSTGCIKDLGWWTYYLHKNPGRRAKSGTTGNLAATWGDGSGTGTEGTIELLER